MIEKVISGGQTGVDIAGLKSAALLQIATGGWMPLGFRTLEGPKDHYEDLYRIKEHWEPFYPPRTELNVKESDGTIRIATTFRSSGEKCTLKFINKHNKPSFDVLVRDTSEFLTDSNSSVDKCVQWIKENNIKILNCAGNSEQTAPGIEAWAMRYLVEVLKKVNGLQNEY